MCRLLQNAACEEATSFGLSSLCDWGAVDPSTNKDAIGGLTEPVPVPVLNKEPHIRLQICRNRELALMQRYAIQPKGRHMQNANYLQCRNNDFSKGRHTLATWEIAMLGKKVQWPKWNGDLTEAEKFSS